MTVWRLRVCVFLPRRVQVRIRLLISGESGAIGVGLLYELMNNMHYQDLANRLQLDASAHVLLISTEGDTSPDIYEDIVWNGRSA
ncbi:diaminopropionate ammonia-lyase [Salmonella enterica subsp. enterica]|uniref:Diaminopropionate ammonia-lyase n=1 Tax=Salmonella enterica I TaxID=59201 RepID=A0A3S4LZM9_SALET|nr:diaminopropionate ammonia-lyase [Salmonella enterica subsp. enterica]